MRKFGYRLPDGRFVMSTQDKSSEDPAELKALIASLERELADAKLRARILDTAIDIAEDELKISIRKKVNTNPGREEDNKRNNNSDNNNNIVVLNNNNNLQNSNNNRDSFNNKMGNLWDINNDFLKKYSFIQ